jgi:uncharacterized membrane protein
MIALPITLQNTLQDDVIVFPILFTIAGVLVTGFMWVGSESGSRTSNRTGSREEDKRERLTHALRDLSDNELIRLRQRLASGDIDDDQLARLLDESEAAKAKRG